MFRLVPSRVANALNMKLSTTWQRFMLAVDEHKWFTYTTFLLILVIFILLLPRACNYP
jgi:hypothetical protein